MAKKTNIEIVVEGLQNTREACTELLTEQYPNLAIRCDHQLNILINQLAHAGGVLIGSPSDPAAKVEEKKPTHFLGIPITGAPSPLKPEAMAPSEEEKAQLQESVDQAFIDFQTLDANVLKKTYDELTIRALAVKVGMDVTPTNPEKVNAAFIREVITAVKSEAEKQKQAAEADEAAKVASQKTEGTDDKKGTTTTETQTTNGAQS